MSKQTPNEGARFPSSLPGDAAERKKYPMHKVLFGMFPDALVRVTKHAYDGSARHNGPSADIQDARDKSSDDADCIMRHLLEGDYEALAWRALRLLQKTLEAEGAPMAPLAWSSAGVPKTADTGRYPSGIYKLRDGRLLGLGRVAVGEPERVCSVLCDPVAYMASGTGQLYLQPEEVARALCHAGAAVWHLIPDDDRRAATLTGLDKLPHLNAQDRDSFYNLLNWFAELDRPPLKRA